MTADARTDADSPRSRPRVDEAELMRALADRFEIQDLLVRYANLLDDRSIEAYAGLFAEDGEWIGNLGSARGRQEITALMYRELNFPAQPSGRSLHIVFNPIVRVDGDRADARSGFAHVCRDETDRPRLDMMGHYEDVLRRTADGWRFERRRAWCDMPWNGVRSS